MSEYTADSWIRYLISDCFANTHMIVPGIVKSFNLGTQMVTVQPALRLKQVSGKTVTYIDMDEIIAPAYVMGAGGFYITTPIEEGDSCILLVSHRGIDKFLNTQKLSDSGDYNPVTKCKTYNISDAICLVGKYCTPEVIEGYNPKAIVMRNKSGDVKVAVQESFAVMVAGDSAVIVGPGGVFVKATTIQLIGNVQVSGTFNVIGTAAIAGSLNVADDMNSSTITTNVLNAVAAGGVPGTITGQVITGSTSVTSPVVQSGDIILGTHRHLGVTTGSGTSAGPTV